jgi:trans-aconitate 2-methyltransferase
MWDPGQYLHFADERSRPFFDLLGRVGAENPGLVVDLGCGPGQLTATLASRWPDAEIRGIDNSAEMIEAAGELLRSGGSGGAGRLSFELSDVREWQPEVPVDVIISNAVLQWVPDHMDLLPRWAGALSEGGWLAFQVPGNFDQPSHAILRELAGSGRWRPLLADVQLNRQAEDPGQYLDLLAKDGCDDIPARAARCGSRRRLVQGHRPAPGPRRAAGQPGDRIPRGLWRPGARGVPGSPVWHGPSVPAGFRGRQAARRRVALVRLEAEGAEDDGQVPTG